MQFILVHLSDYKTTSLHDDSHIPEEICEYCASRMEFQQVYKHSSTTTQCNKHVLSTAWSQSSCSMAQVFMSLSPLLHPRYCSYCCNVCILVLTPTCSCEGSLYYNVLFPSKYISGMPKAMKRKRLLQKQNGFFLVLLLSCVVGIVQCLLHHLVMATICNPTTRPRKCSLSSEIVGYMQEQINQIISKSICLNST